MRLAQGDLTHARVRNCLLFSHCVSMHPSHFMLAAGAYISMGYSCGFTAAAFLSTMRELHLLQSMLAAGAYISMGYSLCSLVGGQLSKEFRLEQPGAFNFLFGIFGARVLLRWGGGCAAVHWGGRLCRRARRTAWGGRLCCRLLWLLWLTWQQ